MIMIEALPSLVLPVGTHLSRVAAPASCSAGKSQRGRCVSCLGPQRRTWSHARQQMLAEPLSAGPEGRPACPSLRSPLYCGGRTPPAPTGTCGGGPGLASVPGHGAPVRPWSPEFKAVVTRGPGAEKAGLGGTQGSPPGPADAPASRLPTSHLLALCLQGHSSRPRPQPALPHPHSSPVLLLGLCSLLFKHSPPSVIPGSSRTPALGVQTSSSLLLARAYLHMSTRPTRSCVSACPHVSTPPAARV